MINKKKIIAIIPARSGSKGLKNKNIKKLGPYPLVAWPIMAAKKSKYIDKIVVSTDSKKIAAISKKFGLSVPFLRPKKISGDKSSSFEVIKHCLSFLEKKNYFFDYIILIEPTSPLTTQKDIDKALEILYRKKNHSKSIVSVSKNINTHPSFNVKINKNGKIKTNFKKFKNNRRRQDLAKVYFFDGSFYISEVNTLLKEKTFYHRETLAYVNEKWKAFEIDDIVDFICVEALIKNTSRIKK